VIINAHNFTPTYLYPTLRTTLPIAGYYARLDAGAAATDQFTSDGSQDGTLTNGASRAGSPVEYQFDGTNDYITMGNQSVFNFGTGSFTLSFWVKTTAIARRSILNKFRYDGTTANEQGFYVDVIATGHIRTSIETPGVSVSYLARDSSVTINNGAWHHVAIVRNGTNVFPDIYIDGTLRNGGTFSNGTVASISSTADFEIAREWDEQSQGQTGHFVGSVDDLVVYGIALDSANIGYLASQRGAIYATA
jgi:hypothetical protein